MDFVMIKTIFQIVNMIMTIAVVWMTHMHTIIVTYVSANLMRQIIQFLLKQNLLLYNTIKVGQLWRLEDSRDSILAEMRICCFGSPATL